MRLFNNTISDISINNLKTIVCVNELTSHDMIYVYHLLSIGTKLKLEQTELKLNGNLIYKVLFNHFTIGFIEISKFSKLLFSKDTELEATIFNLSKEKYLPLKSLEISVQSKQLKLVS